MTPAATPVLTGGQDREGEAHLPVFDANVEVDTWIGPVRVAQPDGTEREASVLVKAGKIVHVGNVAPDQRARERRPATGLFLSPGLIDLHSHSDGFAKVDHLLAMGVTTIVVGQDGSDDWATIRRKAARPNVNVVSLVGHGDLRRRASLSARTATPKERERLQASIAREMATGAFGVSLGLEYEPGRHADRAELHAVFEAVGRVGGLVMVHLRSEDDDAIDGAIDEVVQAARGTGAKVHIAHLKIVLGHGVGRAEALLSRFDQAALSGVELTADIYPYDASYTSIGILFPDFAKPPFSYEEVVRRQRPALARALRDKVLLRNGPTHTRFGTGPNAGRTLAEVADSSRRSFEDVLIELGPGGGSAAYFVMDGAVVHRLIDDHRVMFGSDGSGRTPHPRGTGTFAKVLGPLVRDAKILTLPEAVMKASTLSAKRLGLVDRGSISPGEIADLVLLDPNEIQDLSTFEDPRKLARGVRSVWIGGQIAWDAGHATSGRGVVLTRSNGPSKSDESSVNQEASGDGADAKR